jgi:hypothetical protein
MADLYGFDANEVDPNIDFDPIPAGKYEAVMTESEMKPNKAGTGSYLQCTFVVTEGEFKGRVLWARLNLDNPNATAVKIAKAELSSLCRAVGVMRPRDSSELHDLPLVLMVRCKKRADTGELSNEIKGFAPKVSPAQAATSKPAPAKTMPWKRN